MAGILKNRGFTILEMSLVLVVIGLIVGSVIVGQDLLASGERRKIINDAQMYKSAAYTFRNAYGYWPGDFPDVNPVAISGLSTHVGNGDGTILTNEILYAFQHLSASGIVPGNYDGTTNLYPAGPGYKSIFSISGTTYYALIGNSIEYSTSIASAGIIPVQDAWSIDQKIDDGAASTGKVTSRNYSSSGPNTCVNANWASASANYVFGTSTKECIMEFFLE